MSRALTRMLVKEHRRYTQRFPNDMERLRSVLKPGDVLLVEGSQRISEVIKYLTQSSWSHAGLYVGDALVKRGGARAEELQQRYGDEASSLLVEATIETGVAAVALSKYSRHNLRICRPLNLNPGDLSTVLETVITELGTRYNIDHAIDLLRYLLPLGLLPKRWRLQALESSARRNGDLICSSQIAKAFQSVRYPVQPGISDPKAHQEGRREGVWAGLSRLLGRNDGNVFETSVFTPCDPFLVTPRDFDLSPYFEIVKFNVAGRKDFDYKKLNWAKS